MTGLCAVLCYATFSDVTLLASVAMPALEILGFAAEASNSGRYGRTAVASISARLCSYMFLLGGVGGLLRGERGLRLRGYELYIGGC
jgi:hypothetical protein